MCSFEQVQQFWVHVRPHSVSTPLQRAVCPSKHEHNDSEGFLLPHTTSLPFPAACNESLHKETGSSHEDGKEVCLRRRKRRPRSSKSSPSDRRLHAHSAPSPVAFIGFTVKGFPRHLPRIRSCPLTPGGLLRSPYVSDKQAGCGLSTVGAHEKWAWHLRTGAASFIPPTVSAL